MLDVPRNILKFITIVSHRLLSNLFRGITHLSPSASKWERLFLRMHYAWSCIGGNTLLAHLYVLYIFIFGKYYM